MNQLNKFMFAGNAAFTVVSKKSNNHMTFRVKTKRSDKNNEGPFFVSVRGSSGESVAERKNWNYLGTIFDNSGVKKYVHGRKSQLRFGNDAEKAFQWLLANVDSDQFSWEHTGTCGRCARQLTDPVSIKQGFGPECINYV